MKVKERIKCESINESRNERGRMAEKHHITRTAVPGPVALREWLWHSLTF